MFVVGVDDLFYGRRAREDTEPAKWVNFLKCLEGCRRNGRPTYAVIAIASRDKVTFYSVVETIFLIGDRRCCAVDVVQPHVLCEINWRRACRIVGGI